MEIWGYSTHIDMYECDPFKIKSANEIMCYIDELCKLIDMRKFGECILQYFGDDEKVKGYTFIQMIETSLISGHLVDLTNEAHIDIFSCKPYDAHMAFGFTVDHFLCKKSKLKILER